MWTVLSLIFLRRHDSFVRNSGLVVFVSVSDNKKWCSFSCGSFFLPATTELKNAISQASKGTLRLIKMVIASGYPYFPIIDFCPLDYIAHLHCLDLFFQKALLWKNL